MKKKKQISLFLMFLISSSFLISCNSSLPEESTDTPASVSEETTGNNIELSSPAAEEYYMLYTEDSSNSMQLAIPEDFELLEFSDETFVYLMRKDDENTLNVTFVLWKHDPAEIERIMKNEAGLTAVPDPSFSGTDIGDVHEIMIGDLAAQGFPYSYTTTKKSMQGYRIWIPRNDGTSLVCIIECESFNQGEENAPAYTEEMSIELIQKMISE